MNKQIVVLVVGVVVLVAAYVAQSFSQGECQKPSSSTQYCYKPDDMTETCEEVTQYNCGTANSLRVYERAKFPVGIVIADKGATTEESTKCWRSRGCRWDTDKNECNPVANWESWR